MKNELKYEQFYELVQPRFSGYFNEKYPLVEFCAGNGKLTGKFDAKGAITKATFVDVKKVRDLEESIEQLSVEYDIDMRGIEKYNSKEREALASLHACGTLTDKILETAVESRNPVAVMTCCYGHGVRDYDLENPPDTRLMLYDKKGDYYDAKRAQYLRENNFEATVEKIDDRVTPKNNVIIGIPQFLYFSKKSWQANHPRVLTGMPRE